MGARIGGRRIVTVVVLPLLSAAVTVGLVEVIGRFFLTPLLVRYSANQALKLQLAKPKDLGIASLYVPHHYYLYAPRPSYARRTGTYATIPWAAVRRRSPRENQPGSTGSSR